jgi:hypothetical protein
MKVEPGPTTVPKQKRKAVEKWQDANDVALFLFTEWL